MLNADLTPPNDGKIRWALEEAMAAADALLEAEDPISARMANRALTSALVEVTELTRHLVQEAENALETAEDAGNQVMGLAGLVLGRFADSNGEVVFTAEERKKAVPANDTLVIHNLIYETIIIRQRNDAELLTDIAKGVQS